VANKLTQPQIEAKERLLKCLPEGQTIYTIVRRVSRSGMPRHIQLLYFEVEFPYHTENHATLTTPKLSDRHPTYQVATLLNKKCYQDGGNGNDTIRVDGCGMDMCWHLVNQQLSYALYGKPNCFNQRAL
jgi:hypothetical protein